MTPKKPLKLNDGWRRFIAVAIEDEHDRYFTAPLDKAEQTQSFIGGLSVKINGKQYDAFYPRDGLCQCGKHYPTIKDYAFHLIRYLQQRAEHIEVTHDRARTPASTASHPHEPHFAVGANSAWTKNNLPDFIRIGPRRDDHASLGGGR